MGAFSEAVATILRQHGGEIRTGVTVEHVLLRGGAATGVVLAGGEEISARVVLSNADPKRTLLGLVGERALDPDVVADLHRYRTTGCSFKINCALDALPHLRTLPPGNQMPYLRGGVVISPTLDYLETAYGEAKAGQIPRRPYAIMHVHRSPILDWRRPASTP